MAMKAIAAAILILGLLQFAKQAPDLFKTLFAAGGDLFKGLDLNPHGQIGRSLHDATDTLGKGRDFARGIGHAAGTPFRLGKGIAGGISGAKAGHKEGGFLGGARGMIAGGRAGYNNRGFRGTLTNARFEGAGAGAISNANRSAYGNAQSQYNTTIDSLMGLNKVPIDKQKEAKKELEAQYNDNINSYINEHAEDYQNNYLNQAVRDEMTRSGRSEADVRADTAFMEAATNDAGRSAVQQARQEAEALYKGAYEADKSKIDNKIAELQGQALAGNEGSAEKALNEFFKSQKHWGNNVNEMYTENFNNKMKDNKMDAEIANTINDAMRSVLGTTNTYAGGTADTALTNEDISKLVDSINKLNNKGSARTAAENANLANQRTALAQIMNQMDSAAKKTNSNISVASTTLNTYSTTSQNNSNGGGNNS